MKHSIELTKDNIIVVHLIGTVSTPEVEELGRQVFTILTDFEDKGFKKNVLLDYSHVGEMADETNLPFTSIVYSTMDVGKMAVYFTEATRKYMLENDTALKMANPKFEYQSFTDLDAALSWLKI